MTATGSRDSAEVRAPLDFCGDVDERDREVQEALDDPRPGDIFHEMYSFGVQVIDVSPHDVKWRSFNTEEVDRGWETRENWSRAFRYGDHMPGHHTMFLLQRGQPQTGGSP